MKASDLEITLDTWFTADQHFGHDNIQRFCNRPSDHYELMRDNWIESVGRHETIVHLGDLAYRGRDDYVVPMLRGLTGNKYLLRGNHDKKTNAWYERYGFTVLDDLLGNFETPEGRTIRHTGFYWHAPDGERILFSHYPDQQLLDWSTCVHGQIHQNGHSQGAPRDRDYRNISVEVVGYRPQRLRDILYGVDGVNYQSRIAAGDNAFVPRSRERNTPRKGHGPRR
jgi:calcineurin-like phosphoesterase family protein